MKTSLQAAKIPFCLLTCRQMPILEQLQLEEALLRADNRNWCIINSGTSPAIVMGISGKPETLVDPALMQNHPVPLIKRFSGGGTVYVDQDTYFVTWICNAADVAVDCCPAKVYRWSADFYQAALPVEGLKFHENDYVIGDRKWGGNAQYLCKGRWLHHSSLLWDYDTDGMKRLLMPPKMPSYRQNRSHDDFLCRLRDHFPSREELEGALLREVGARFDITAASLAEVKAILDRPHRKATQKVELYP